MDKEILLKDFTIYLQYSYDDAIIPEIYFDHIDLGIDYAEFLKQNYKLTSIENNAKIKSVDKIESILSDSEIRQYIKELNENIEVVGDAGYEDGVSYTSKDPLNIERHELSYYFNKYIQILKIVNCDFPISIYLILISNFYQGLYINLNKEVKNIAQHLKKAKLLTFGSEELFEIYKRDYKEKLKNNYIENINNSYLQLIGFYDEKGLSLNYSLTFRNLIELINNKTYSKDIISIKQKLDTIKSISLLLYQYFDYNYFGKSYQIDSSHSIGNSLKSEFDDLKSKNDKLVKYLLQKSFSLEEIDIVFNSLSENRYASLNIRYYPIEKAPSDCFRFYYCFYLLEYFNIQGIHFQKIDDFKCLTLFNEKNSNKRNEQQLHKYFKNINSSESHNHYPFKRIDYFKESVYNLLKIEPSKLRKIPEQNYW